MKANNFIFCIISVFAVIVNLPQLSLSQPLTDSTVNFCTLSAYYDNYYDSLIDQRGIENMQGTGYKDYLRWKWFYLGRHGVNGSLDALWEGIRDYHENYISPPGYTDESYWSFLGPRGIPYGHNGDSSYITGKGMMLSLWVSGGDHSLIYAGSHHGGLWKTIDGGDNWFPLHDPDSVIHGVNSIAVDPEDHKTIYITCNNSLGEFSGYYSGLFKSTDGGNTWDSLTIPGLNYPTSY